MAMPVKYSTHFTNKDLPQSQPMCADQISNSAGGYTWAIDDWARLDRFVVLGTEGGTYYADERKLTTDNTNTILKLIDKDGIRVVERVVELSQAGRAYKNDAAIFVLALAFSQGDEATRKTAEGNLHKIARTGTHLFTFLEYVNAMRGWGRALRRAVGNWYQEKETTELVYQITKYQQRNGWSHRDALRLAHPKTKEYTRNWLYQYIVGKAAITDIPVDLDYISACEKLKKANSREAVSLIRSYDLPREVVPTGLLNDPDIWTALLEKMPMTAMIRNLATLTRVGVIKQWGKSTNTICERLTDKARLKKARIHPIQILAALTTYQAGKGARGGHQWTPIQKVVDALDKAFYLSFDAVEPTGKRVVLALDVSGSMSWGTISGVPGLTPRIGSAALALITAATEKNHIITAFSHEMVKVAISPRQRLDDVIKQTDKIPMGGTDCSLPMVWAMNNGIEADAFVIMTDNETWAGQIHPAQALQQYRHYTKINTKLVVVGMISTGFSIADPKDPGMLDCVGFSTDTPTIIADFIRE
jgi:60 kDa SS-A/Ro ribonucleoprotein